MLRDASLISAGTPTLSAGQTSANCFLLDFILTFGEIEGDFLTIPPPDTPKWFLCGVLEPGRKGGQVSSKPAVCCGVQNFGHNVPKAF